MTGLAWVLLAVLLVALVVAVVALVVVWLRLEEAQADLLAARIARLDDSRRRQL